MDKKERFFKTINRETVDRPAWWVGLPTEGALKNLYSHTGSKDFTQFKQKLNDDIWAVEMPYRNGTTNAIYAAFDFTADGGASSNEERTLTKDGYFKDKDEPDDVNDFNWPDPSKYIKKEDCLALIKSLPKNYPILGVIWSAQFQDACAAFGMEEALIKIKTNPLMFKAVIDRITEFYLKANEIFYTYMKGHLDAVLVGNDFGTQSGLIVSPSDLRELAFPGIKKIIEQAHSFGLKVLYHSCGAVNEIIGDLIECGADAIHPIQALAAGMEPHTLKQKYGNKVAFCGGIDAQYLLVQGTPSQIKEKVKELCGIFPTGLIVSPSHEAILPDVPPQNVLVIAQAMNGK